MYVMSPTGIDQYRTCPRKFYEQYITRFIKWQSSPAINRGNAIHECLAKVVDNGPHPLTQWPNGLDMDFVTRKVEQLRQLKAAGVPVYTEHELVVDKKMKVITDGWWSDDAWLRAKADVVVLPKQGDTAAVYDWKTGKNWSGDKLQLRLESLLIHLIYKYPKVKYAYWYVDNGTMISDSCDFSQSLGDVQDIIDIMRSLQLSIKEENFPCKKNKFCRWCILENTEKCR